MSRLNYLVLNQTLEKIVQKNQQRILQPVTSSSTIFSTTSPITSTTTTTTTSTTTTPQIIRLTPHVTEFRLTSVTYDQRSAQIMISYLIRTNVSSGYSITTPFQIVPASLTIDIECRSSESDQQWTRVINQTVATHYISSSTSMLPRSEPKPGSFIRCSAQTIDASDRSRPGLFASANLLIEPAPVSNLFMKRNNETSIELIWMSPGYFYDYLDMICYLDEDIVRPEYGAAVRKISERLFPKSSQVSRNLAPNTPLVSSNRHPLNNLIPGAVYNCTLITVRSVLNFTTRSKGETAYQMTGIH